MGKIGCQCGGVSSPSPAAGLFPLWCMFRRENARFFEEESVLAVSEDDHRFLFSFSDTAACSQTSDQFKIRTTEREAIHSNSFMCGLTVLFVFLPSVISPDAHASLTWRISFSVYWERQIEQTFSPAVLRRSILRIGRHPAKCTDRNPWVLRTCGTS